MEKVSNIVNLRAKQLSLDNKVSELDIINIEIKRFYSEGLEAVKLSNKGILKLSASSSVLANEARYRQIELIEAIDSALPGMVESLRITTKM